MIKLFLKAASVLLLAFLTYGLMVFAVFFCLPYMDSGDYMSAILDKDRLLRDTPSPKIVFVGASNLAFGLDSERVQSAMHLPVVNLGLHGGIGLKFMLDSTRPYVKKGDTVVLVPEYEEFFGERHYGEAPLLNALHLSREGWRYIDSIQQYRVIWRYALTEMKDTIHAMYKRSSSSGKIYSRKSFNRFGDMVAHLKENPRKIESYGVPLGNEKFNDRVLADLEKFRESSEGNGAAVLILSPSIAESAFKMNRAGIREVYDRIRAYGGLGAIQKSTPEDYVFPDSCFFDTAYHLTGTCRETRTEKVIAALREITQPGKPVPFVPRTSCLSCGPAAPGRRYPTVRRIRPDRDSRRGELPHRGTRGR